MMYIEHTSLEDNLHHILTNRVPTSSSPGATEAVAVAASALLARVREAQNGASAVNAPVVSQTQKFQFNKEWLHRIETKPVPSLKKLPDTPKSSNNLEEQEVATHENEDGFEEEQYELLHVDDSDQQQQESSKNIIDIDNSRSKRDNRLSTSHFVIDVSDAGPQQKTDDEEEFEYVVTRVPKRKRYSYDQCQSNLQIGQGDSFCPLSSQKYSLGTTKAKRPVPSAIPIETHQRKLLNGNLRPSDLYTEELPYIRDYSDQEHYINGYPQSYIGPENWNHLNSTFRDRHNLCYNEPCKEEDAQMGLNIINKLRQLLNWNPSSSSTTDQYNITQNEGKRKRRSGDLSDDSASDHMIKYRKVDNRFPKYVSHTQEDDDVKFLHPPPPQSSAQSSGSKQFHNTTNMTARRSNSSLGTAPNSLFNYTPVIRDYRLFTDKPPQVRKSMFQAPNITKFFVKNTSYADFEFSDDDEPILIKPSTSAAAKHLPNVYNIPIGRTEERDAYMKHRPPPPPLIEPSTGNIFASSLMADPDFVRKNTYSEALLRNRTREMAERNGHILSTRNHSISSSAETSVSDSRLHNGFNNLRTNPWPNATRSSILAQERESEQREKYQQLLQQLAPRLYGSSTENKIPTPVSVQRRRSALLLGAGSSASSRSSSVNARRSIGLNQSILKRPPLSSTINLDDEEDDDVTFGGISHMKPPSLRKPKEKQLVPTIVIDDDDVSDIAELGTAERHVLSQVGKIKQEEISLLGLSTDKSKKSQSNALPYVEPVNSLKDRFSSSIHLKDNWLDNLQIKWSQRKRNKLVEVQETVEVAEKLAAERKAAEAEIQERLRSFQIVDPELLIVDDFEDLIPEPEFVELNEQHRATINAAVFGGPPDQVLVSKFNLNITRRDIHTLCGQSWLNDEVINFYMNLLTERGDIRQSQGLPSVYAMNTFFVPRLLQAGHGGVKRWTRKVDIFSKDIIPLPVHVGGVHWCMAIIHLKNRTIKYYDSMGTPNPKVLHALEQYLKDESLDKRQQPFDTSGFQIESVQNVPRQMNGSDCGVFSCMFAEYITRDKEITFSQQNMEYFRQKMILEIVTGQLLQ